MWWAGRIGVLLATAGIAWCTATATASAATWAPGDVVVGEIETVGVITDGRMRVYAPNGVLKEAMRQGSLGGQALGCRFDRFGMLHTTNFESSHVVRFAQAHPHGPAFAWVGGPHGLHPSSIAFAVGGGFYVGFRDGGADVARFTVDASGKPTLAQTYDVHVAAGELGAQWVELLRDQRTLLYTSQGRRVRRYDLDGAGLQLPDFATLPGTTADGYRAMGVRALADGSRRVLVADYRDIKLLGPGGAVERTYDAPGSDAWFALALDPNGQSFWAGDAITGQFYRFSTYGGQLERGPFSNTAGVGGLCVLGEPVWATVPSSVGVADATVAEGDAGPTAVQVALTLNTPHEIPLSVDVTTAPITATQGADYEALAQRVTFAPGEMRRVVEVPVLGDLAGEADETFEVRLSAPSAGLVLGDGVGRVTIVDDDRNGLFSCRASALRVGTVEPFVFTGCADATRSSPSASAGSGSTSATATDLTVVSEQDPDDLAGTKPAVGDLATTRVTAGRVSIASTTNTVVATGLAAEARTSCGSGGVITTASSSVGSLTRNGTTLIGRTSAHVHYTLGTATIHINHPVATGSQRALWLESPPLGGEAIAVEAIAGPSGDPC